MNGKERGLWLFQQLAPDSAANHITMALRSRVRLDYAVLRRAASVIAGRHEALRRHFPTHDGHPVRSVREAAGFQPVVETMAVTSGELQDTLHDFAERPFDLGADQLIRIAHIGTPDADVVCVTGHHIILDGPSAVLLIRELVNAYNLLAAGEADPGGLFSEVPALAATPPTARGLNYWNEQLAGVDAAHMELECGHPRPPEPAFRGGQFIHRMDSRVHEALTGSAAALDATGSLILLATFLLLLAQHGAGPDLTVGVPVDPRGPAGRTSVGHHTNIVVLRADMRRAKTFRELVAMARDTFLTAIEHADVVPDDLLMSSGGRRDGIRNPFFRHLFNYFDFNTAVLSAAPRLAGEPVEVVEVARRHCQYDLELMVRSDAHRTELLVVHGDDALDRADALAMAARFESLLLAATREPDSSLDLLPRWSDRDHHVLRRSRPPHPVRNAPEVLAGIIAAARTYPEAIALVDGATGRKTTYAALLDAAAQKRADLLDAGASAESVVALDAHRGVELAAGVLAAWSLGAACLVLDHAQPAERIAHQLERCDVRVLLGDASGQAASTAGATKAQPTGTAPGATWQPLRPEPDAAHAGAVAFVTHSWRPSQQPEEIRVTHGNLAHALADFTDRLDLTTADSGLWSSDVSAPWYLEAFVPLLLGGHVVTVPGSGRTDASAMAHMLDRYDVAVAQAAPSVWRAAAEHTPGWIAGRRLVCGGEPLPPEVARYLLVGGARVFNCYGLAQYPGWMFMDEVREPLGTLVPVGQPTAGSEVFVLDRQGRPQPPGLRGSICVSGPAPAPGPDDGWDVKALRLHEAPTRYLRTGERGYRQYDGRLVLLHDHTIESGPATTEEADAHLVAQLVAVWREILQRDDLDADTDFFTAGGNSMLAALLVVRIEEVVGAAPPLGSAFAARTPAAMAARWGSEVGREAGGGPKPTEDDRAIKGEANE
ncbi:condensation domain-containing protein [Streptomyces massasporeus]|uniref:condensation domain-containing protein n=1 Tax=Streptomyces massasporeus TaxID=67324 RepID=UPI0036FA25B0